jgi:hypothetical protein
MSRWPPKRKNVLSSCSYLDYGYHLCVTKMHMVKVVLFPYEKYGRVSRSFHFYYFSEYYPNVGLVSAKGRMSVIPKEYREQRHAPAMLYSTPHVEYSHSDRHPIQRLSMPSSCVHQQKFNPCMMLKSHPPPRRSHPRCPCRRGYDRPHHRWHSEHRSTGARRPRELPSVCR